MDKDIIKAVRTIVTNLDAYMEAQVAIAKLQRARYKALLREGFPPEQAIELCKKIF